MGDPADKNAKGHKGYRLTAPEKSGRTRADFSNWRKRIQASKLKFDDTAKGIFLNVLAKTGRRTEAANAAGVHLKTILDHRNVDPEFEDAFQEALGRYADTVHVLALKLMNGVKKPIVGGKDKDEIITHEIVHATNLLAMEMRRTNPEYKEKTELEINGGGGILLVPETATDVDAFLREEAARTGNKPMPGSEEDKK